MSVLKYILKTTFSFFYRVEKKLNYFYILFWEEKDFEFDLQNII